MKLKIYITSFLLLAVNLFYAQVGVGTTNPNASSILDISSVNSGLLIPRIALLSTSDVTTIPAPAVSLLVFNSGFSPNGYYYWNGTVWVQLATVSNTYWSLTGNSGTTSATNFLGTTDDVDLVFKRNNIRAGFIGNPNISTGNKNTSFGGNSLNAAGTGIRNTAIGTNVMPGNTTGQLNVSIGDQSMFLNQGGSTNIAIGVGTLYSNVSGNENVALGRNALTSANNSNNTALGFATLRNATGTNNIAIGHQAGYNETGSNKLYIEMSTAANGTDSNANNALIYGEFDNRIVRANGTVQIGNPTVSGYALPTARGTAGQFLQTDGAGATAWTSASVLPYTTTGAATGIYNVTLAQYTVRVFGGVSEVRLPTPVGNTGKVFVIIGSYGIPSKTFSTAGGLIYDDVTNTTVTTISGSVRYTVQSDGTDWIVIGN